MTEPSPKKEQRKESFSSTRSSELGAGVGNIKAKKSRTPQSCDRCKSRKTKCVNPVPGPCEYCAHIGAQCGVARRQKQRPYYHVSEEEYRCSMQILQHFFPTRELNLQNLREISKDLQRNLTPAESPVNTDETGAPSVTERTSLKDLEVEENEEISDLHDQVGCLMEDSLGEYRYVGAFAEIAFNDAVCSIKGPSTPEKPDSNIISPPKCAFPPQKPTKKKIYDRITGEIYLPPREYCTYYVARFFQEVHCIYWLYPAEQFHTRLEETYANHGATASNSWMCSLYAICALGAASDGQHENLMFDELVSEEARRYPDRKSSQDYLTLAKGLVAQIHEEADIDSIRALAILSIALQTFGFRIMSYLYIGTSIRIAFSLGFQHDKSPTSQSPMIRQQNRRIWWTLYILDQEIASRCGSPFVADERNLRILAPLPSEQILNPGTHTPLGFLPLSVSLCRLKREIIQTIYPERSLDSRTISFSKVTTFISQLQTWLASIPPHLKWGVPVAPTHKRAISILHLNYWDAMMLLTQPFLLYLSIHKQNLTQPKKAWFEKLGQICIDAAQNAIAILRSTSNEGNLSSLVTFDCTCVLKIIMILVLALANNNLQQYRMDIEVCLSLIRGMEKVGWSATVEPELSMRLASLGVMKGSAQEPGFQDDLTVEDGDANTRNDAVQNSGPGQPLWPDFDHGHPCSSSFMHSVEDFQNIDAEFGTSFPIDMNFMDMDMDLPNVGASMQGDLSFYGEEGARGIV